MYNSWPRLLEVAPNVLASYCGGALYTLSIEDTPVEGTNIKVLKEAVPLIDISIPQGLVYDFHIINRKLFLLTKNPDLLYVVLLDKGSLTFVCALPKPMSPIGTTSLGNYGSNLLLIWATPAQDVEIQGWVGMLTGNDALVSYVEPLTLFNPSTTARRIQLNPEEQLIAVTHPPNLFGAVAKVSPRGAIFYALSPFSVLRATTDALVHIAPFYNIGGPHIKGTLHKLSFCGWQMLAKINAASVVLAQDPLNIISTATDWINVQAGETLLDTNTPLVISANTPISISLQAKANLSQLCITTSLGVFTYQDTIAPNIYIPYLAKGDTIRLYYKVPSLVIWQEQTTISVQAEVHTC